MVSTSHLAIGLMQILMTQSYIHMPVFGDKVQSQFRERIQEKESGLIGS